jgi:hypothetical protein
MKLLLLLLMPVAALAQTETLELGGQLGSRPALLVLHASRVPEGEWQIAGEYIVLTTLQRRFLEGEASPQIRVTSLREGTSPILFGRPTTGELRGTWKGTSFRGTRYAPGGQERERFEFSEGFPSLEKYSANIHCDVGEGQYSSTLNLAIDAGRLRSIDWRSKLAPSGHVCAIASAEQQPMEGGLRFAAGKCTINAREIGEYLWLTAANCADQCGSQAYIEPLVIDRRGYCRLLRPESTR